MKMFLRISSVLLAAALIASPAASVVPRPGAGDPRNRVVAYDPAQVVELQGVLGYQMLIAFAPDEKIENVAVGDSLAWQVTPNRAANLLFVKPMSQGPVTNMTVVTNLRHYAFELSAVARSHVRGGRAVIYTLQFEYPPAPKPALDSAVHPEAPPQVVGRSYSYDGSEKTLPAQIFDDGHATYFQFPPGTDYPAIFAVDAQGEAVVNFHLRDGYLVVDRLARSFVLRRGNDVTHIYNDGYQEASPGPQSPQPRKRECKGWFCP